MNGTVDKILEKMRAEPANLRFADLQHVILAQGGWPVNPRVNSQNDKGKAKLYQVRQVLLAIERLGTSA